MILSKAADRPLLNLTPTLTNCRRKETLHRHKSILLFHSSSLSLLHKTYNPTHSHAHKLKWTREGSVTALTRTESSVLISFLQDSLSLHVEIFSCPTLQMKTLLLYPSSCLCPLLFSLAHLAPRPHPSSSPCPSNSCDVTKWAAGYIQTTPVVVRYWSRMNAQDVLLPQTRLGLAIER